MTSSSVPIIKPEELCKKEKIGNGLIVEVYKGTYNGKDVAIKELLGQEYLTEKDRKDFEEDVNALYRLQHETILSVVGAVFAPGNLSIVTEFCSYGDLEIAMEKNPEQFNNELKLKCLIDVADALKYMHENNIVHRNVKLANIFIASLDPKSPVVAKLCVFDEMNFVNKNKESKIEISNSPLFYAPEILAGSKTYEKPADVYCFSTVMHYVFTGRHPYQDDPTIDSLEELENRIISGKRPAIPPSFPTDLKELMEKCWDGDPSKRPTFEVIHSTLQKMDLH